MKYGVSRAAAAAQACLELQERSVPYPIICPKVQSTSLFSRSSREPRAARNGAHSPCFTQHGYPTLLLQPWDEACDALWCLCDAYDIWAGPALHRTPFLQQQEGFVSASPQPGPSESMCHHPLCPEHHSIPSQDAPRDPVVGAESEGLRAKAAKQPGSQLPWPDRLAFMILMCLHIYNPI